MAYKHNALVKSLLIRDGTIAVSGSVYPEHLGDWIEAHLSVEFPNKITERGYELFERGFNPLHGFLFFVSSCGHLAVKSTGDSKFYGVGQLFKISLTDAVRFVQMANDLITKRLAIS